MATLYKHGELGQIERVAYKLAYCQDGKILRNDGDGWKIWRKLKPGVDPKAHFAKCQADYTQKMADLPMFAAWRELFHETIPFRLRGIALQTVKSMPDDPDGVYSELNDYSSLCGDGDLISVEEAVRLCSAYRLAFDEGRAHGLAKRELAPA